MKREPYQYARKGLKEALVVTRRGKPLMALTPIKEGDGESVALATSPKFMAIIERSRASHKLLVAVGKGSRMAAGTGPVSGLPVGVRQTVIPRPKAGAGQ
jgi:hypothetical protein